MITNGRYYTGMTGETEQGNEKYSQELKQCIEEAGAFCIDNINSRTYAPGMLLGRIQSGKTRAFIGLMALCFDNDFDMAIILTKCSKALVQQTVKRMMQEFDIFHTGHATIGDVIAQDILDIDFSSTKTIKDRKAAVTAFLHKYKRKKRILIVKKQADNVDRMNMLIEQLTTGNDYKRILLVDDEADVTSIGYGKGYEDDYLSLRRISGAINTARNYLHSEIECAMMQVTATPYALYLQPEEFSNYEIMPIRPARTIVMPTGDGYIGGQYYFIDSQDETSENYEKAKYLPEIVGQEEMGIINGSGKNSSKNAKIKDGRTVKIEDFIAGQSDNPSFALPSFRKWLFDILVGAAIIQSNNGYEEYYVSAVMHAATAKNMHEAEAKLIEEGIKEIRNALFEDINNADVRFFAKESYDDIKRSVEAYGELIVPTFTDVMQKIAYIEDEELSGLISEVDIKRVNSDHDIMKYLDDNGELRLEASITIFVGGQVLDRGITIPNMINFFYGRDPEKMQQDTVVQHCRMFGYRSPVLLSVTRFYTTNRLFGNLREITLRDEILRDRIIKHDDSSVIYLEASGDIRACSPVKIMASEINSIMPERRYLPVGFEIRTGKREAEKVHDYITNVIKENGGFLDKSKTSFSKGQDTDGMYVTVDPETAMDMIKAAYSIIDGYEDGVCNKIEDFEPAFWFSISELNENKSDRVALIVRKDRKLKRFKHGGELYQDAPDDGNNEGALAKILRKDMPVLVLTEQTDPEWKYNFWWPVYYTPDNMNVGIYAEAKTRFDVTEDFRSLKARPVKIGNFQIINDNSLDEQTDALVKATVTQIVNYYNNAFLTDRPVETSKSARVVDCPIYLEAQNKAYSAEYLRKEITALKMKAINITEAAAVPVESSRDMLDYFDKAIEEIANDEVRQKAFECIEQMHLKKYMEKSLINLIERSEDILYRRNESFGLFVPIGYDKFRIHLYTENMEYYLDDIGQRDKEHLLALLFASLAHEMFHAIHFADVMTESGRWSYIRKGREKENRVKESMAEYFALSFCMDALSGKYRETAEKIIREMRDKARFPEDPYCGAIVLEDAEKRKGMHGNKSPAYVKIHDESLDDMLAADEVLLDCKEQKS